MIPSYYSTPESLVRLRAAVAMVLHTPFFPNSEVPGPDGGMDCVHTLNFVWRQTGAIGLVCWDPQPMDGGQHGSDVLSRAFADLPGLVGRFSVVPAGEELLPGDGLLFRDGKMPHHAGLMLEHGDVLHALKPQVQTTRLNVIHRGEQLFGRLVAVYRPLPL